MLHDEGYDLNDCVLTAFGNPLNCRIRRLRLRHSSVTDHGLKKLLKVRTSHILQSVCKGVSVEKVAGHYKN